MELISNDYIDFLYWLKTQTESFWSKKPKDSANEYICDEWMYDAKWIGMTENEIEAVQDKYSIVFTPEHKDFLRILHTIDRKTRHPSQGGGYVERPYFFNWLTDDLEIKNKLNFPYNTIIEEVVTDGSWLKKSWDTKPDTLEEGERQFNERYKTAPELIPIRGHRFQVADMSLEKRPILSVLGFDIVLYGVDFRDYLLHELADELDIYHIEYDEDGEPYWHVNEGYEKYFKVFNKEDIKSVPFWRDFILR